MAIKGILKGISALKGLGFFSDGKDNYLYYQSSEKSNNNFVSESRSTDNFEPGKNLKIADKRGRKLNTANLEAINIAKNGSKYSAVLYFKNGIISSSFIAETKNLRDFKVIASVVKVNQKAAIVSDYKYQGNYLMYQGGDTLRALASKDLKKWQINKKPLLLPKFGGGAIEIATAEKNGSGIQVVYFELSTIEGKLFYTIGAAIFEASDPFKLIIKSKEPIWEQPAQWNELDIKVAPIGIKIQNNTLISYWTLNGNEIFSILHAPKPQFQKKENIKRFVHLKKHSKNPIISPNPENFWESKATFNPAAIYDQGKIHIIYRAIGDQDMSMLGYAATTDGVHIDERLKDPIYIPTEPFEFTANPASPAGGPSQSSGAAIKVANKPLISPYASGGGGYGGVEDPRITRIGNKIYMTYVAYNGNSAPRVALTSIGLSDFRKKSWKWEKPVLISKPNEVNKNAVLFPEKINGKYVFLHRVYPDILVDFVDDLDFDGSQFLKGEYKIQPSKYSWDNRKIGAGAPPILTERGWLLIYQAVGESDSGRYKIGAMLLDENDPTNVLARSYQPILEPIEKYENDGFKAGVVYPCGAVVKDEKLLVYYGGADMYTCCAKADLDEFVDDLASHGTGNLRSVGV